MEAGLVTHEFDAFFDKDSRVLILGTIPSPKSREQGFYYGHPQNRFWKVVSGITDFRLKPVHRFCQKVRIRWWKSVVYCRPCLRFLPLVCRIPVRLNQAKVVPVATIRRRSSHRNALPSDLFN